MPDITKLPLDTPASGDTLFGEKDGVAKRFTFSSLGSFVGPFVNVKHHGAAGGGSTTANRDAFENAAAALTALGGGVLYVPPSTSAYKIATKTWTDAGNLVACIRIPASVELYLPAGATIQMADNTITGAGFHVIVLNGADAAVTGTGIIDGGSLNQASYSTYAQNGPTGVFIRSAAQCHRARIGAGAHGYLTIRNCFGNPVNGGGALGTEITDVSVCGLYTDNVGEGPQIERADRVEMRRIVSLNTTGNMSGDGAELAGVTNFRVSDIYAEGSGGSGFDLFGCQSGSVRNVTCINCNFDLHDFAPVDPCSDVRCDDITVIYNAGGIGSAGIHLDSVHATIAPKNIKVRGRVINQGAGALANGVHISQAQDVATYGGGPYEIDVDVQGATNAGLSVVRVPGLRGAAHVRDCDYGFNADVTGLLATDNVDWNLDLDISGSSTTDVRVNGTESHVGILSGRFSSTDGLLSGLYARKKVPSYLSTALDSLNAYGIDTINFTGATLARIAPEPDGTRKTIYSDAGFTAVNAWDSGIYKGINSKAGPNASPGDGSIVVAAKGRLELMYSTAAGRWLEV